jgi:hypothetical protein
MVIYNDGGICPFPNCKKYFWSKARLKKHLKEKHAGETL